VVVAEASKEKQLQEMEEQRKDYNAHQSTPEAEEDMSYGVAVEDSIQHEEEEDSSAQEEEGNKGKALADSTLREAELRDRQEA
jgi:hypothetical protein